MNTIKKVGNAVVVTLDPEKLITSPAYKISEGKAVKTGLSIGSIIGLLARTYVLMKAPHLWKDHKYVTVEFTEGNYVVKISDELQ